MHIRPDFIRPSFKRTWNSRKIDHDYPLVFSHEAEQHFAQNSAILGETLGGFAGQIAQQMTGYDGHSIISAIPCFALENPDFTALSNHVSQIAQEGGHVVIFVNAGSLQLQGALTDLANKLAASLHRRCPQGSFSVASGLFDAPQPIGRIRGILNDAIVLRSLQLKVRDPIIVSNDIDGCYTPPGYVQTLMQRFSDPCLDILSGPLYYGYSPLGDDYVGIAPSVPDLFLGNRVLEARRLSRLGGYFDGEAFFTTEGPHTAFRASAYCAAGGYDVTLEQAEDDELGIAIFALRQKGHFPFPTVRNAIYAPEFWLVTNPRRQLLAIANGLSIIDTWRGFPIKNRSGHEISLESAALQNRTRLNAMRLEELNALVSHRRSPIGPWSKVIDIFLRGASDRALPPNSLKYYLKACGVSIEHATYEDDASNLAERSEPSTALREAICRFAHHHYPVLLEQEYS